MKVQSDQQIVASKTKMLDRMKASVSLAEKCKLKPVERIDLGYEWNQRAIEECKKLGILVENAKPLSIQQHLEKKAHCQLSIIEKDGCPISTSLISFQLPASNCPQPADCTIIETGPGLYEISYTPVIRGAHHVSVTVGGVDIPGSLFLVPVLPPFPETRGQPLHTIQGLNGPTVPMLLLARVVR